MPLVTVYLCFLVSLVACFLLLWLSYWLPGVLTRVASAVRENPKERALADYRTAMMQKVFDQDDDYDLADSFVMVQIGSRIYVSCNGDRFTEDAHVTALVARYRQETSDRIDSAILEAMEGWE